MRMRLLEIGETVKDISATLRCGEPHIHAIVAATVEQDLPPLVTAVRRMRETVGNE